jgi:YVTN family beta-propeller protein
VIDGVTNLLINTIPAGRGATALCYNSVNNKVYCANYRDSSITVINGTTDSVIHTIHIDFPPEVLSYNFRRNKIYSGCYWWGCRYGGVVIDGNSDSVITHFPEMYAVLSSYYNWINDKVYLGPFVIDGVTDSVITYFPYALGCLVWDPLQNKTYGTFYDIYGLSLIIIIRDSILPAIEEKPTSQIIRSSISKTKENLFDITGRKVERQHLRRGVYFLKEKEYIQKVILLK